MLVSTNTSTLGTQSKPHLESTLVQTGAEEVVDMRWGWADPDLVW